jgi:uncharacterized protein (DUF58 family)
MVSFAPLPLSAALLERYRIKSRQHSRPSMVGGHLMRRKGQSLEFRELVPYTLGDDIRHVDWQASARHGSAEDLLIRSFVTEEQLTLVISVDTRDTMRLPKAMPKIQIAFWLAEAIAWIALRSGDRVILHRPFGKAHAWESSGSGNFKRKRSDLRTILRRFGEDDESSSTNMAVLRPYLSPAAVWLVISDFYFFAEDQRVVARAVSTAQDGMRWVILVDLDSWPHEQKILGTGARVIEGPGYRAPETPVDVSTESLEKVISKIKAHKQRFWESIRRSGCSIVSWEWPSDEQPAPDLFFRGAFMKDKVLQRLFMKDAG